MGQTEVETTLQRISSFEDVVGTIVLDVEGNVVRSTISNEDISAKYAAQLPGLAAMARSAVRELDPQNDLQMLRIKSHLHEIIVLADLYFTIIVVQSCSSEQSETETFAASPVIMPEEAPPQEIRS
ncbi:hypothetical protein O6H91_06G088400 [Diphasiastrum complanatum]|nr:hypothetical protein O6H91_Y438200 [Diphasiastrum complanatum]KAJ7553213.1 hypothetical protein O6H91_06G088400 [Diphasiastrum complanatum]